MPSYICQNKTDFCDLQFVVPSQIYFKSDFNVILLDFKQGMPQMYYVPADSWDI